MTEITPSLFPIDNGKPVKSDQQRVSDTKRTASPFKQALQEAETGQKEDSAPRIVQIKEGDTLSDIVNKSLKKRELPYTTKELYHWVKVVAQANGLSNPDMIYAGQKIDLSVLHGQPSPQKIAMIGNTETIPSETKESMAPEFCSPVSGRLTSGFGMRIHPLDNMPHFHNGTDIAAPAGTPVSSTSEGVVTFAGSRGGYGNCIDIDHGDGWLTRYAHLQSMDVGVGDQVQAGSQIGAVGSSGRTTGPHLHLEAHHNGRPVDPLSLIPVAVEEAPHIALNTPRREDES